MTFLEIVIDLLVIDFASMSSDFKFDDEEVDDNLEESHCTIDKVYVFQIPKLTGASTGHSARDWPKQAIWSGRLRVVSKGRKCSVLLEHLDKDGLFAACPYTNKSCVEQVSDSSRYFVLRVTDGQGHFASIGIGFKQRSEAFNFKVALQDFENQGSRQEKAEEYLSSLPSQDYAIPQGKSIHVKLAAVGADTSTKTKKKKKKKEKGKRRCHLVSTSGSFEKSNESQSRGIFCFVIVLFVFH